MTRSTTKKLTEPLDKTKREFHRRRRAAWRQRKNESLAMSGRNLFDDEASSSTNGGAKPLTPIKPLRERSLPSSAGFQNHIIISAEQTRNIVDSHDVWLIQGECYASFTSPSKQKQKNGLIKHLPPKSRRGSNSSHDSSITSFQQAVPRSFETLSFDSNRGLRNLSKAPRFASRI
nr:hypothetical protein [Tanacetum cinerariifolium]